MFRRLTRRREPKEASEGGASPSNGSPEQNADDQEAAQVSPDTECQMLIDMGFNRAQAEQTLQANGGDLSEAIVALVGMSAAAGGAQARQDGFRGGIAAHPDYTVEELDAVLDEALQASKQEAHAQKQLEEAEKENLDAALAASLECMGPGPAPGTVTRELPPVQVQPWPPSTSGCKEPPRPQQEPPSARPEGRRKKSHHHHNHHHKERRSPHVSSPKGAIPPPLLTPEALPRSSRGGFLVPGGLEPLQHRSPSVGSLVSGPLSGTPLGSRPMSMGDNASVGSQELVALDDLEGWNRGSGLFGVASLRSTYPARLLPVGASPHGHRLASPAGSRRHGQEPRPGSRAGRAALSASSSSPLLAAAALSIS